VIVKNNKATNIDITMPFENRIEALTDARQQKINKYAALARILNTRFNEIKADAIVLGSTRRVGPRERRIDENDVLVEVFKPLQENLCRTSLDIQWTSTPSTSPESDSNEQVS
jgi:hypothetical protein